MAEEYILRWNNFNSMLTAGCVSLLENGDLADVTISADGTCIPAHRFILSIFSPYFRKLFKDIPSNHPFIVLKDVSHEDLSALLQFMYTGEVCVQPEKINSLMKTAAHLEIKGLMMNNGSVDTEHDIEIKDKEKTSPEKCKKEIEIETPAENNNQKPEIEITQEVSTTLKRARSISITPQKKTKKKVKSSTQPSTDIPVIDVHNALSLYNKENESTHKGVELQLETATIVSSDESSKDTSITAANKNVKCSQCDRMFANSYNLKIHVRDMHNTSPENPLICPICNKLMKNQSCLRMHVYNHKKQINIDMAKKTQPIKFEKVS